MATLKKLNNARIETILGAPGKSMKVDTDGHGENDAELYHTPGVFSKPHDNVQGIEVDVNGLSIIIATHNYKLNKSLDKGESIFYSIDADGNILSSALVNDAGEFVINDGTRSAAAFDKLKEGFDKLKSDFNDLVTAYNAHTGHDAGPVPPAASFSTADIDDSEVTEVLLP